MGLRGWGGLTPGCTKLCFLSYQAKFSVCKNEYSTIERTVFYLYICIYIFLVAEMLMKHKSYSVSFLHLQLQMVSR